VSVGSNATTNSLSGYYGTTALNFQAPLTAVSIAHLRVAHAKGAIAFSQGTGHTLSHVQIVNCGKGLILNGAEVRLRNALMVNVTTNFDLASSTARVEHLTTDGTSLLNTGGTLYLTNSLVVAATATNGWSGLSNVFVASATGVFASVGNGAHYLASGSPYRDVGTASIDATLDKELKTMTTVAPIWLSSAITTATTLGPLAARDTDQRDCGYHYPALDYLLSNVTVQAALTLTNGVALGLCGTAGLNLQSGSSVRSEGTPIALNRFAGIPLVQEQPVPLGQAKGMIQQGFYNPLVRLRFTDVSLKGGATVAVFDPGSYAFSEFSLRDSWLRCADFSANPSSNLVTVASAMTNNVIERGTFSFYHSYGSQGSYHVVSLYNNLFSRSTLNLSFDPGTGYIPTWRAQDNLFDGASPSGSGTGYATYVTVGYNGFTSGTSNGLGGNNNKTGLTADFVTGSLGAFYYPTNGSGLFTLVNAGSRTATNATLCQFTVSNVAGSKDSGTVEIGFHYVAIDSSGLPYDTDGDGISDDQEDRNGSGSVDSGETDWQTSNSGISGAAGLQVFTPLH
jgi:hypothetical protein